ncbi:hypothetical protein LSTR_LSTR002787 [Laodelphax striatellus]|uniref:Uncharacterized protein n=1 Tax=Laodelphax striatellus TaxID=195883 RepID=A0A482XI52_LAOST|nr:hypothetical protein LSTR_LSTR002787 [Laodelphax striatellus]
MSLCSEEEKMAALDEGTQHLAHVQKGRKYFKQVINETKNSVKSKDRGRKLVAPVPLNGSGKLDSSVSAAQRQYACNAAEKYACNVRHLS